MTPDVSRLALLREQIAHHDRLVSRFTRGLSRPQAVWTISGARPSTAWLLGHLVWVTDSVVVAVAVPDQRAALGPDQERHADAHWGVATDADWQALIGSWESTAARRRDALESLGDDVLALPPAVAMDPGVHDGRSTRERFLVGHVFHLAYHLGQIGTLRAEQGLGWQDLADPADG